jgi:hypothetical protein
MLWTHSTIVQLSCFIQECKVLSFGVRSIESSKNLLKTFQCIHLHNHSKECVSDNECLGVLGWPSLKTMLEHWISS